MERLPDRLAVETLDLDPTNPRLPEELQGSSQHQILQHLYENDVLEELIDSFVTNKYFESEPLIVLPPQDGRRTVVEGNRRLAALMILHQLPPAVEAGIPIDTEPPPTAEQLRALDDVPAVQVDSHSDVAAYLGFRHISGLKRWDPEAKARWLWRQVDDQARTGGTADPFYVVGQRVGSNARGVRSSYLSYSILRFARDVLKLPGPLVQHVLRERFGVWTRLLGTANVTAYIGMGETVARDYNGVLRQVEQVDADRLREVLEDLTPPSPRERPILGDSRNVTEYSDVLPNDRAREAMREFRSLSLAVEIARQADLANRLQQMTKSIEVLTLDVRRYEIGNAEVAAADELAAAARTLLGAITAARPEGTE